MKKSRLALFHSFIALLLCLSMLVGTTFAWFTDYVVTGINTIAAGVLDVQLHHSNAAVTDEQVDTSTKLFMDLQGDPILWEPGVVSYENLRITNAGDLALTYQLSLSTDNENFVVDASGAQYGLSQILKVGFVEGGITATDRDGVVASVETTDWTTLADFVQNGSLLPAGAGESENVWGIVIYWQPGENDNFWNLNNGKTLNEGDVLSIDLGVHLIATQEQHESDSFGNDYDATAKTDVFPVFVASGSVTTPITPNDRNQVAADTLMTTGQVSASIPAGVQLAEGTTELTMSVTEMDASGANITLGENEAARSLDVHIDGIDATNTVAMVIDLGEIMPVGLNSTSIKLYHVENGTSNPMIPADTVEEVDAHNEFHYEPATGRVVVAMASFSEVTCVIDELNPWEGKFDYTWYNTADTSFTISNAEQLAAFGAIVGGMDGQIQDSFSGKTVKLIADINLGDKNNENTSLIFYPIGYYYTDDKNADGTTGDYYSTVYSFEGTFDGSGHIIANFYHNTWEIKGDYDGNYYKDAMGLFGYVKGGTVKNLTVDHFSSDGEFTPTGVIAAYADGDAKFENIAITNCNPRVYNTGNGGIIGIAGSTSTANDDHITLKNITVDNSNKISALWGSWDVACGGLVGMYRGNVDGSGNATGDTISFTNCHVAAQIDVNNDVCANYQYYAYRYAGMIIGSIRHNTTNADGKTIPNMTGISASGCTVNYGTWNDYYYCEFEKNSMASYSEDYQFSRVPHSELNFTDSNGNGVVDANERASVTGCKHTHTAEEDKQAVYLPFHQLFTGYSWGVSSIGLEELDGIENITVTIGKEESVLKFDCAFPNTTVNDEGVVQTNFLYRVGNQNTVNVGSLFAAKDGATINGEGVYVRIDKVYDDSNVSCTFTPSTTKNDDGTIKWETGTLKFEGTGVVDIVIQDYDYCEPTTLHLEVVDATNTTTAANATEKNIVLLKDCGFGSVEVSNGYTLYGNGFTMTCSSDSAASDMGSAFVTLNNGTLDNVQIVCPNFDYAALYKTNLTSSSNRSETDASGKTRYYNAKSGVMASGNSQILNSRISGARAAVNVSNGNVVIDNSRIELGAVASILVGAANSLTLRDVTLVQKPTVSTHDSSKTLMGFSVLVVCNADGSSTPITLEGSFIQNAWIDESDAQYAPSAGQTVVNSALEQTDFLHDLDGDGTNESLNLGIAYMPADLTSPVNTTNITDSRTDATTIPYEYATVSVSSGKTYVYSYKNTNGTDDSFQTDTEYVPDEFSDIITVTYSDTTAGLTTGKSYGVDGWIYELNVDLDTASGYELDFSKLSMSVNGVTVTDFKVNGSDKPADPIAVTAGGTTYVLTTTINSVEYTATLKVTGMETSKESPSLVASNYEAALLVGEAGNMISKDTWHGAAPVLNGIQIKYWSVAEKQYKTITLSDYTPTTAGKQNETNAEWTYSPANGDFTLTIKNEIAVHSNNGVYAMPVVVNSKLYFVASGSNGLVNYGNSARTIKINYYFKDNNGGEELKFDYTWSIECANDNTCYDYSDFCGGTSKTFTINSSNGDGCVTGDALVTLANGGQKRVDELTYEDELLVWDFYNGKYATTTASVIYNHGDGIHTVTNLHFSDGTLVKMIAEHEFYDAEANSFVYISEENVADFIGHEFVKANGDSYTTVTLTNYSYTEEETGMYTILTAKHFNALVEGMFSLTPDPTNKCDMYFRRYEMGEDMKYDEEKMQADIEKYGLYTYEDFAEYVTYEEFVAFDGGYLKVLVGKGWITYEDILNSLSTYAP